MDIAASHKQLYGGRGPLLVGICWSEAIIGTILVGLRAYSASRTPAGKWRWDFIWALCAITFGIVAVAFLHVAALSGLGNRVRVLNFGQLAEALHWIWMCIFLGLPAMAFGKFAAISLLLGIETQASSHKRAYALYFMSAVIGVMLFIQIFISLFQCQPYQKLWDIMSPGTCKYNDLANSWSSAQGIVSAIVDAILGLWPISIVWNLKLRRSAKLGFCLLMSVTMLPAFTAVMRVYYLPRLLAASDPTYAFFDFIVWAVTEAWSVVILGSIPPLRPLFIRIFNRKRGLKTVSVRKPNNTHGPRSISGPSLADHRAPSGYDATLTSNLETSKHAHRTLESKSISNETSYSLNEKPLSRVPEILVSREFIVVNEELTGVLLPSRSSSSNGSGMMV